ncbi:MAG: riboflavin biosynthesis protein RibF [Elusimicrobiaceae bacterium]|nr:riboflavin biosynthesis protein RibF [Elusimicrobiaceae bacterium]
MKNFITIGTMDGVHLGHAAVIAELARLARAHSMKSLVLFLDCPPKAVLSGDTGQSMITLPAQRRELILRAGADRAECLEFSARFASVSHGEFFETLVAEYQMGGLLIGRDFAFGRERLGHLDFLRAACARRDIPLRIMDFRRADGHKISSSIIRKLLVEGHVEHAARLLGRCYSVGGTVVRGKGLGRRLGFPTANLDAGRFKILPRGVYAVRVALEGCGRVYGGMANVGFRPTVNTLSGALPLVEVHILDFSGDLYGQNISVEFVTRLRHEKKFKDVAELSAALAADVEAARSALAETAARKP